MDAKTLRELVNYDATTGLLHWVKDHPSVKRIKAGNVVGPSSRKNGYRCTTINGRQYYQHRLVWLHVHGEFPQDQLDHVNGDQADNRLENLRIATRSQNAHNKKKFKNNTSGSVGAYEHWSGRWYSSIMVHGKYIYLGMFATKEEASAAYAAAKKTLHPFSPDVPTR